MYAKAGLSHQDSQQQCKKSQYRRYPRALKLPKKNIFSEQRMSNKASDLLYSGPEEKQKRSTCVRRPKRAPISARIDQPNSIHHARKVLKQQKTIKPRSAVQKRQSKFKHEMVNAKRAQNLLQQNQVEMKNDIEHTPIGTT